MGCFGGLLKALLVLVLVVMALMGIGGVVSAPVWAWILIIIAIAPRGRRLAATTSEARI